MQCWSLDTPHKQKPLSLRWNGERHWPIISDQFGVSKAGASVVLSLATCRDWQSYSRREAWYAKRNRIRRYRDPLYRYATIVHTIDHLADAGLVENTISDVRGWQSAVRPTPALIAGVERELRKAPRLKVAQPRETIILRDANGELIDYRDSSATNRMRKRLESINAQIRSSIISGYASAQMFRVFNQSMDRGGRFYAAGGAFQGLPKGERANITIDGEAVTEIDYNTLHPAMLYAMAKVQMIERPYEFGEWPREINKLALLILINATSKHSAVRALARKPVMEMAGVEPKTHEAHRLAQKVVSAANEFHKPISAFFGCDMGAQLMRLDSTMAENIMFEFASRGETVLPIHDSFIVRSSMADQLQEAMQRAAFDVTGSAISSSVV